MRTKFGVQIVSQNNDELADVALSDSPVEFNQGQTLQKSSKEIETELTKALKNSTNNETQISDNIEGRETTVSQPVHNTDKVGRNEPCPCGSGLKYKNCCGKDN